MEGNGNRINFSLPEQKLVHLSFCEATTKGLAEWISGLPVANVGETSRQLYTAILELNQLVVAAPARMQLLEIIRPSIHFVCKELSKHFLNQSIALPEKQRRIANLAQAVQTHLATGYKMVLQESQTDLSNEKGRKQIATSCQRILSEISRSVLRSMQLYCPNPARSWLEAHQIFRFAASAKLNTLAVPDDQNRHQEGSSVDDAYKRLLLLGCCKPNQLRQSDLNNAFEVFESWSKFVDVGPRQVTSAMFVVNMDKDMPPLYRSLVHDALTDHFYGFDTTELAHRLTEYLAFLNNKSRDGEQMLPMPIKLHETLIAHLSQSYGILTKRTFKRIASTGRIELCVGLSATHYFSSGCIDFNKQVIASAINAASEGENIFLSRTRRHQDAWHDSQDAGPSRDHLDVAPVDFGRSIYEEGKLKETSYKTYNLPLVNTSPGGYCVHWESEVPASLQAGEILGIRECADHPWSIGAIRWIRQVKQQGTQIGVELLAPAAVPCAVQLIQKTGDASEYLRGLLLPELSSISQPATLITPRLPFQTGHKVQLKRQTNEEKYQLSRRIAATGSFNQFELKQLGGSILSDLDGTAKGSVDDFDSLWPTL